MRIKVLQLKERHDKKEKIKAITGRAHFDHDNKGLLRVCKRPSDNNNFRPHIDKIKKSLF
jgi:hypothetical protein